MHRPSHSKKLLKHLTLVSCIQHLSPVLILFFHAESIVINNDNNSKTQQFKKFPGCVTRHLFFHNLFRFNQPLLNVKFKFNLCYRSFYSPNTSVHTHDMKDIEEGLLLSRLHTEVIKLVELCG